jgi:hypothetical protein
VLPNGTQKNRGAVKNAEEQTFLEDTVRERLNFILKEYGSTLLESEDGLVSDSCQCKNKL